MCVHPKVNPKKSKLSSSSSSGKNKQNNSNNNNNQAAMHDINHACSKLTKERKCRFRNNLEGFVLSNDESSSSSSSSSMMHQVQQPVLDIEELVSLGQSRSICPFYFTKSQIATADIVFIPYNYLFDSQTRQHSLNEIEFENSIIIFDEAHNLESFASESASFDFTSIDIAGCMVEVNRCLGYVQAMSDHGQNNTSKDTAGGGGEVTPDNLLKLKAILIGFEKYLEDGVPAKGGGFSGDYIFEIFDKGCRLNYNNYKSLMGFVGKVSDYVLDMRGGSSGGGASSGTPKLDHFASCVRKVFGTDTEHQSYAKARSYRVHISPKIGTSSSNKGGSGGGFVVASRGNNNQGRTLSYWCFSPCKRYCIAFDWFHLEYFNSANS